MKNRSINRYSWSSLLCGLIFSFALVSCGDNEDDVSWLISGSTGQPAPTETFGIEGSWVLKGLHIPVASVLGMDLSETLEELLLGVLNEYLPVSFSSLSAMEVGLKTEPAENAQQLLLSCSLLNLLTYPDELQLTMNRIGTDSIASEGLIAALLGELTLIDYTEGGELPGLRVGDSALYPIIEEMLGGLALLVRNAYIEDIVLTCQQTSLEGKIYETTEEGTLSLSMLGNLSINTTSVLLAVLKEIPVELSLQGQLTEWLPLAE